jgi:hypothetical protein
MGMFDWYRPAGSPQCPACGAHLREWQGKDGPCALFVWAEGETHPVAQEIDDEEVRWSEGERSRFALPERFTIYSHDCPSHGRVDAECRSVDGTWSQTVILTPARRH